MSDCNASSQKPNIIVLMPQLVFGRRGGLVGGYVNSVASLALKLQNVAALTIISGLKEHDAERERLLSRELGLSGLRFVKMWSRPGSVLYVIEFCLRSCWVSSRLPRKGAAIEVVYGHSGHPVYALVTSAVALLRRAVSIHALYCPIQAEFQHRQVTRAGRMITLFALKSADAVVGISENVCRTIRERRSASATTTVILPAIPDSLAPRGCCPVSVERDSGSIVLGFVGHHKPEKGLDIALDALKALSFEGFSVYLSVLATGAETHGRLQEIQRMISERGLQDRVRISDGVNDIADFFSKLDCLLVPFRGTRGPSDYPMVLLESLAFGLPAVCTPVGAIPEVIQHRANGFLSSDCSAQRFAEALREAVSMSSSERARLAGCATASASRFRASAVCIATMKYISDLYKLQ